MERVLRCRVVLLVPTIDSILFTRDALNSLYACSRGIPEAGIRLICDLSASWRFCPATTKSLTGPLIIKAAGEALGSLPPQAKGSWKIALTAGLLICACLGLLYVLLNGFTPHGEFLTGDVGPMWQVREHAGHRTGKAAGNSPENCAPPFARISCAAPDRRASATRPEIDSIPTGTTLRCGCPCHCFHKVDPMERPCILKKPPIFPMQTDKKIGAGARGPKNPQNGPRTCPGASTGSQKFRTLKAHALSHSLHPVFERSCFGSLDWPPAQKRPPAPPKPGGGKARSRRPGHFQPPVQHQPSRSP